MRKDPYRQGLVSGLILSVRVLPAQSAVVVRAHLAQRLLDRSITTDDLSKLKFWIESDPDVPEEGRYKDFGTFKLAGRGPLVLTFLMEE
ncbi:MAG: hypothetical protein ABSB15_25270 [Bryobacteraceae bacterium]